MEVGKLTVEERTTSGKNETRRLRKSGKVPAVCYGHGGENLKISVDPKALKKSLDPSKKENTVIAMTLGEKTYTVMVKDFQMDRLRGEVTHVDFLSIDEKKEVRAAVPVNLVGKSPGVVAGGTLHAVFRTLWVYCTPANIPNELVIDVSSLNMGDAVHAADMTLPPGVRLDLEPHQAVASVLAPEVETVDPAAAAAAAVTAATTPAAGAKAAAGAKPAAGAKAAAGAPAKADAKKK